jgi:hypothetical protein
MRAILGLTFVISLPAWADITNAVVGDITSTQAILRYTAPSNAACKVEVSESASFTPLVHDVDTALFTGADQDSRAESLSNGAERVFVIGKRRAEQAANGHWYSRALQALTAHYYRVTCGPDQITGSFLTTNIPLGNTYNEALPPNPNITASGVFSYTGQYAWPEFTNWNAADPAARQEVVIDPQTGMALKRMTMPMDKGNYNTHVFQTASAPTGVWTSPVSALGDDGASATYSGTGRDWLVLIDPAANFGDGGLESLTLEVKGWCSGTCAGEDRKVQVCLTVNGVSCWPNNSNVYEIALGTSALPSTFSTYGNGSLSMFPWTPAGLPPLVSWDAIPRSGQVNVDASGNVTWVTGSGRLFYPGWTAGSAITIAGSACKITSVSNPQSLAVDPASCSPALSLPRSNAAFSAGNFGVMIRKKTATTDTINIQYARYTLTSSATLEWPSGGSTKLCSSTPTQNAVTGNLGYHCIVGNTPQVYWIDSTTGDANWLGIPFTGNQAPPDGWSNSFCKTPSVTFIGAGPTDPETFYCVSADENNKAIILMCALTSTNQTGNLSTSCQNLTPGSTGKDLFSLIVNFTRGSTPSFDTTQFVGIGLIAVQNGRLLLTSTRGFQDTATWAVVFDPALAGTAAGCVGGGKAGCVIAAQSSWASSPARWCTLHSTGYAGEVDSWVLSGKYFGDWPGMPGGGFFSSTITSAALTSTPAIPAGTGGCPPGTNGCDIITVDGEPCNMQPGTAIGGHPAEPLNCQKNSAWSYLQDAAPGDVFGASGGEFMRLISKSGNQWLVERGVGGPGVTTPSTPTRLDVECLARSDNFVFGVSALTWIWDFLNDPHGQNSGGTTVHVEYPFDHQTSSASMVAGGAAWYDPNNRGGYAILDGTGFGQPNKYAQLGPAFAGTIGIPSYNELAQEHPSYSQYSAPASEKQWFLDSRPLSGPGPTSADLATLVAGQLYKFASTTADGDNLTFVGGGAATTGVVSRKIQPTMMFCGTQPLVDVSSATPGNTIATDATSAYQYCVARKGGECRSGSARGDIYANCPYANPRINYGQTYGCTNIYAELGLTNDLCINNTGAYLNGMAQIGFQHTDPYGTLGRTLTHGLMHYRMNNPNENVRTTPDGLWLLFEAFAFNGSEYSILSGKMLPFPTEESANRTAFVPLTLQLDPPGDIGVDNAVVQFGYTENGSSGQFYCTSRREACIANSAAVNAVPFAFASDGSDGTQATVTGVPCASGCAVTIPALPQHMVYYQVQYRDASNQVIKPSGIGVAVAQ